MYVNGFFKLGQLPTALSGTIMLALSLAAGYFHVAWLSPYRRKVVALSPWSLARQFAQRKAETITDLPAMLPNSTSNARAALTWSYGMNCAVVAIAIFHAGVFPLYKSTSTTRYKHKMQDGLASFGWFFLSLHHVANLVTLLLLLAGPKALPPLAPAALLLPGAHLILRAAAAWLPPNLHFRLGTSLDWVTHAPLLVLYLWRTVLLGKWEAVGVAAEALHLASVLPEYFEQRREVDVLVQEGPTSSYNDPFGEAKAQQAELLDTAASDRVLEGSREEAGEADNACVGAFAPRHVLFSAAYHVDLPSSSLSSGAEPLVAAEADPTHAPVQPASAAGVTATGGPVTAEPALKQASPGHTASEEGEDTIGRRVAARHRHSGATSTGTSYGEELRAGVDGDGPSSSTGNLCQRVVSAAQQAGGGMSSIPDTPAGDSVASDVAAAAALPLPDGRNHLAEAPDLFVTPTTGLDSGGMLNKIRRRLFDSFPSRALSFGEEPMTARAAPATASGLHAEEETIMHGSDEQDLQDALRRVEEMARQGEEAQKANQVLFQEAKQQIRRMQDSRRRVPVYLLLLLINCASFFFYGGLMAITSAPTVLDSPPFHTHPFHLQGYVAPQPAATHMVPDVPDIPIQARLNVLLMEMDKMGHEQAQHWQRVVEAAYGGALGPQPAVPGKVQRTSAANEVEQALLQTSEAAADAALKAKPAAAHAAAQMADMAAGTYTSAEEAIHKAASAAQKGAQACKKAVTPSARAYQKAEHSAKQATRAALAAHSAAGPVAREAARDDIALLSSAKDRAAHAAADATQLLAQSPDGEITTRAQQGVEETAALMWQTAQAAQQQAWDSAAAAMREVHTAAQELQHRVAPMQGKVAGSFMGTMRQALSAAKSVFADGAGAIMYVLRTSGHHLASAGRWAEVALQRSWASFYARVAGFQPREAAMSARQIVAGAYDQAARATEDTYHRAEPALKEASAATAEVAADAAQAAADAFNTAEPVVRKAATAAAQTATDVANAAAGAYHKAEPVARKAALEALQTAQVAGDAADAAARQAANAASEAYRENKPAAKRAATEAWHAAQGTSARTAAAASDALQRAQKMLRETPHAAEELLHILGGASHDVYERAQNISTAIRMSPTLRALVHSAALGSKVAAADCRDACRVLTTGAAHLASDAHAISHHVTEDLKCAACEAQKDLWRIIEQLASGAHRVSEEVRHGAQGIQQLAAAQAA